MQHGEGERLHAERRRRFWGILGALMLMGLVVGFAAGFLMGLNDDQALPSWAYPLGTVIVVLFVVIGAYGSWKFFKNVDEVEIADNLWGSLVGLYTYALLFPAWWSLNRLGQVREPDDWVIFGVSMFTAVGVYLYRKLRYS